MGSGDICISPLLPYPPLRAVSRSKFDKAIKQTDRDFQILNYPQRKLGINYYEKPLFSPPPLPLCSEDPQFLKGE
ncbi:MAG TPA: hypothetical protein DEG17_27070 [Cyanobacteria bacterium UBA11149]|nr:hypothetical protein [Cyanobacteria bacterium UBA11367]HBE60532.1 hypothetical protein [Cyanobacteria bacterium UBA11366]HBK65070.1 hypothetical protein [Cyanobacteria bacterium UBA11166]HBR72228.1 hypothetical protein [Cyanobacteria bacterium UBA11159]HBW92428.1 hypothetical protein [Cyanobacteria bacterium UBA11149]